MGNEFIPYTYTDTKNLIPTSANQDRQLARAPWTLGQYYELESLVITNSLASAGQVILWDQDLSNSTPTSRGSAGGYLQAFGVGAGAVSGVASTTTVYFGEGGAPKEKYYAGIAMQATGLNIHVSALLRIRH